MIAIAGIIGLISAAIVVSTFWKDIKAFLISAIEKFKKIAIPSAIAGFKTYLQTGCIAKALYNAQQVAIQKFYEQNPKTKQWTETVVTREMDFNELPEEIQRKVRQNQSQEVDITDNVQRELGLLTLGQ